jgi:hypothetical protein
MIVSGGAANILSIGKKKSSKVTLDKVLMMKLPRLAMFQMGLGSVLGFWAILKFGMRREGSSNPYEAYFGATFFFLSLLLSFTEVVAQSRKSRGSLGELGDKNAATHEDSEHIAVARGDNFVDVGDEQTAGRGGSKRASALAMRAKVGAKKGIWEGGTKGVQGSVKFKKSGKQGDDEDEDEDEDDGDDDEDDVDSKKKPEKLFDFDPGLI